MSRNRNIFWPLSSQFEAEESFRWGVWLGRHICYKTTQVKRENLFFPIGKYFSLQEKCFFLEENYFLVREFIFSIKKIFSL